VTKTEIARWLTPGLTPLRLVFTTFGGSAHGQIAIESQDVDSGKWSKVDDLGTANGIPETKGEEVSSVHINQITGEETQ
jgi:hypothetical protein